MFNGPLAVSLCFAWLCCLVFMSAVRGAVRRDKVENEVAPLRGSIVMREISTREVVWPLVLPDTRDKERFIHL